MNTVATSAASTSAPAPRPFLWLLRREFWENRGGFLWAPVIAGGIVAFLYSLLAVIGSVAGRNQFGGNHMVIDGGSASEQVNRAIGSFGDGVLLVGIGLTAVVLAFVVFFYALGSLYDDRRDRSVLFWKSLPISDRDTVLAKLTWAALLAPLIAVLVGILLGLVLWLVSALTLKVNGVSAGTAVFTHSHPLRVIGSVLGTVPVYVLWALPTLGWLMLCSAWARSKPFLWAVLVPILACVIISMMGILPGIAIAHGKLWYVIAYRGLLSAVPGTWLRVTGQADASGIEHPDQIFGSLNYASSWHAFATWDLWIGVAVGIGFIAGAIWLRRWRELAD